MRTLPDPFLVACVSCASLWSVQRRRCRGSQRCKQTKETAVNQSRQCCRQNLACDCLLSLSSSEQLQENTFPLSWQHNQILMYQVPQFSKFMAQKEKKHPKKTINKDSGLSCLCGISRADVFHSSTLKSRPGRRNWSHISCYGSKSRNMSPSSGQGRRPLPLLGQRTN